MRLRQVLDRPGRLQLSCDQTPRIAGRCGPRLSTTTGTDRQHLHPAAFMSGSSGTGIAGRAPVLFVRGVADRLQVRLKIAVVANLLVDLQPIALAVGDDDRVAVRIEVDGGRETEPPLRLKALYPASRFSHVRVRIDALLTPFRQHLGIADQCRYRA